MQYRIRSKIWFKKISIVLLLFFFLLQNTFAQDVNASSWPEACKVVEIPSTRDGKIQPAYFFQSKAGTPRPLIVSLHAWSSGYDEKDPLAWQCINKDYTYIHPHFRGPNRTVEACGSPLVMADIDDAIAFAIRHSNVDTNEIHITGVSGGGYATLLAYMQTRYPVKTFSAWVPISNLVDWFYETKSREPNHSLDIAKATTGRDFKENEYVMNVQEAKKRSPVFMSTPVGQRYTSKLYIYAGVHDGYTGSVPITHSINFYNKVVRDFDISVRNALVKPEEIIELLTYRGSAQALQDSIGGRKIHFRRDYLDKVRLTLFEGGHEGLSPVALHHIENKKILTIGDSNGAFDFGWVNQLQHIGFEHQVYNTAISGNTIGFNNNNQVKLNTLQNINRYLDEAATQLKKPDAIVIMLGTNDCKTVFADSLKQVPLNLRKLLQKIKVHPVYKQFSPGIYVVSPPPFGPDEKLEAKFTNAAKRLEYLHPRLKEAVLRENCVFIDTYSQLKGMMSRLTHDGVHLLPEGQKMIADIIYRTLSAK